MAEFASKGVAGTALGLGIAGTVALVNQMGRGNGILGGGLFGGNGGQCVEQCAAVNGGGYVTHTEALYMDALAKKDAEIAQCRSERYADGIGISTFKEALALVNNQNDKQNVLIRDINTELVRMREENATQAAELQCLNKEINYRFAATDKDIAYTYNTLNTKIDTLAREVECKYVPWAKKIDSSLLCPQPEFPSGVTPSSIR